MPPNMRWLAVVVQLAIAPVLLGALFMWPAPHGAEPDPPAAAGLVLLAAIHLVYWRDPWPAQPWRALVAAGAMAATNLALGGLFGLSQPLLWLYPALVLGAGLRPPLAAIGVALVAVAALPPLDPSGAIMVRALGPPHWILLSVLLAGLGMTAVRQLIAVAVDLHATKAELAELAVAAERERLGRELHDLLGRTLSLIAVKAELAGRLSASGDPAAEEELRDVQRLARHAVREVREAVTGERTPTVAGELAAAALALRTTGIEPCIEADTLELDPAHETALAWAIREAVTNVVKHSGARTCRVALRRAGGAVELEVVDDGRGRTGGGTGAGLAGLAGRVHSLGGVFEAGAGEGGGFRLRARLGAPRATAAAAR